MSHRYVVLLTLFLAHSWALAEKIRIVTWNVREAFTVGDVTKRKADFAAAAKSLDPDIILLQEIVSQQVAVAIRNAMGLKGYHVVCSNFTTDAPTHAAFEVAIISRFPIAQVIEYDPSPSGPDDEDVEEAPLEPSKKLGLAKVTTDRGFLWAHVPDKKITLAVVHLKSSRGAVGKSDKTNAQKREFVIAAVAASVNEDRGLFPGYAYLVAGDFNVGHSDPKKNGTDLDEDCFSNCGSKDLYDDTHALLAEGLVGSLKMKNLALSIPDSTFPDFPGSPIDNIYVSGDLAGRFSNAQKASNGFGSDHLAVSTVFDAP